MLFHEPETSRSNESKVFRGIPKISFECGRERGCIPDSLEREIVRLNLGTPGSFQWKLSTAKNLFPLVINSFEKYFSTRKFSIYV